MKKRYIYSLLFGVPGLFISLIISFFIIGAIAGFLWIYIFGDNTWTSSTETLLPNLFFLIFLILWITSIAMGFVKGKKLEADPALQKKHILVSFGFTLVPVSLILLHQFKVGNIGPQSDSVLCSDFCSQHGYSSSGMPPRNSGERSCSCFDDSGQEILKVELESLNLKK
jgi:hypothetical protein